MRRYPGVEPTAIFKKADTESTTQEHTESGCASATVSASHCKKKVSRMTTVRDASLNSRSILQRPLLVLQVRMHIQTGHGQIRSREGKRWWVSVDIRTVGSGAAGNGE